MIGEEDRQPTLLGSPNKHQRNAAREGVEVNSIGALLVKNFRESRGGVGIATAIKLLEDVLAVGRHAIPPHTQGIVLIGLIYAAAGGRCDKRFDPVSPQTTRQGFDINLRAANRIRRERERYMYYFQGLIRPGVPLPKIIERPIQSTQQRSDRGCGQSRPGAKNAPALLQSRKDRCCP